MYSALSMLLLQSIALYKNYYDCYFIFYYYSFIRHSLLILTFLLITNSGLCSFQELGGRWQENFPRWGWKAVETFRKSPSRLCRRSLDPRQGSLYTASVGEKTIVQSEQRRNESLCQLKWTTESDFRMWGFVWFFIYLLVFLNFCSVCHSNIMLFFFAWKICVTFRKKCLVCEHYTTHPTNMFWHLWNPKRSFSRTTFLFTLLPLILWSAYSEQRKLLVRCKQ